MSDVSHGRYSPRKAYYVERPARTITTYIVWASSADEAERLVESGSVEALDSETVSTGRPRARRAPNEDRNEH